MLRSPLIPIILVLKGVLREAEPKVTQDPRPQLNRFKLNKEWLPLGFDIFQCCLAVKCHRLQLFVEEPCIYLIVRCTFIVVRAILIIRNILAPENLQGTIRVALVVHLAHLNVGLDVLIERLITQAREVHFLLLHLLLVVIMLELFLNKVLFRAVPDFGIDFFLFFNAILIVVCDMDDLHFNVPHGLLHCIVFVPVVNNGKVNMTHVPHLVLLLLRVGHLDFVALHVRLFSH